MIPAKKGVIPPEVPKAFSICVQFFGNPIWRFQNCVDVRNNDLVFLCRLTIDSSTLLYLKMRYKPDFFAIYPKKVRVGFVMDAARLASYSLTNSG